MPRFFNSSFNSSSDSSLVQGLNLKITVTLKEHAIKKAFKCAVRSSRTSYRFRSLRANSSTSSFFQEGSKQSVHSFSFTSLRFIRSHTVCIYQRARKQQREEAKHALMQAQSGQSLHASAPLQRSALCPACFRTRANPCCRAQFTSSAKIETTVNIGRGGCMGHLFV